MDYRHPACSIQPCDREASRHCPSCGLAICELHMQGGKCHRCGLDREDALRELLRCVRETRARRR